MTSAPTVSVILICYNGEQYLAKALESVLGQTWRDFELVVVDDGSTDRSGSIVASYSDPRVRYVYRSNGGLSAARNTGIRESGGTWLAFLDCDDWWDPSKLRNQMEAIRTAPEVCFVYSAATLIDEISTEETRVPARVEGTILPDLLRSNCIVGSASSVMIHRTVVETIGGFDETVRYAEDWDFWLRIAAQFRVAKVDSHDVYLLRRSGSHGSHFAELLNAQLAILDRAFATYAKHLQRLRRSALAGAWYMAALNFNQARLVREERAALLQLIRLRPLTSEPYARLIRSLLPRKAAIASNPPHKAHDSSLVEADGA